VLDSVKQDKVDKSKSTQDGANVATSTKAASKQTKYDDVAQKKLAAKELLAQKKAERDMATVMTAANIKEARYQIEWDAALVVEERLLKQSEPPSNKSNDVFL
jgi:RNA-splicing ligase RtcB